MSINRTYINAGDELIVQGRLVVEGEMIQRQTTKVFETTQFEGETLVINSDGFANGIATPATLQFNSGLSNAAITYDSVTGTLTSTATLEMGDGGIFVGDLQGNADTATVWKTARLFTFNGDVDEVAINIDGSFSPTFTLELTDTGVPAGSWGLVDHVPKFTVDVDGRLTLAENIRIDIIADQVNDFVEKVRANVSVDATGLTYDSSTGVFGIADTGVTAGTADETYGNASHTVNFTVDPQGQLHFAQDVRIDIIADQVNDFVEKVRSNVSVSMSNPTTGDGGIDYDQANGIIIYTGPVASETRAHFTGDYGLNYNSATGSFEIDITETVSIADNQTISGDKTYTGNLDFSGATVDGFAVTGDLVISGETLIQGNLNVVGNINSITQIDLFVEDKNITLNANTTIGEDSMILVERGTSGNSVYLKWDESTTQWKFSNDGGTTEYLVPEGTHDLIEDPSATVDSGTMYYTRTRANTAIEDYIIGGDGINWGLATIDVDETVVRTHTDQRIAGEKTLTDVLTIEDDGLRLMANTISTGSSYGSISLENNDSIHGGIKFDIETVTGGVIDSSVLSFFADDTITSNIHGRKMYVNNDGVNINSNTESYLMATSRGAENTIMRMGPNNTLMFTGNVMYADQDTTITAKHTFTDELVVTQQAGTTAGSIYWDNTTNKLWVLHSNETDFIELTPNYYVGELEIWGDASATATTANVYSGVWYEPIPGNQIAHHGFRTLEGSRYINVAETANNLVITGNLTTIRLDVVNSIVNNNYGTLGYTQATGTFTYTGVTKAQIQTDARTAISVEGNSGIAYNNTTGVISLDDTTLLSGVTAGNGLIGGGTFGNITLEHADTSIQENTNNTNGTVIQNLSFDDYGHVTVASSYDLDNRYYTETEADDRFVNVTGDTMTGNLDIQANLNVKDNTTMGGTLDVTGDTTLSSNLGVAGSLDVTGATTLSDTLSVTGDTTLSSNLDVAGSLDVSTSATINNLTVTGTFEFGTDSIGEVIDDRVNGLLDAGTYLSKVYTDTSNTLTINHDNTARNDSANTTGPDFNGTFTAVDSVTTNAQGHVTAVNVKTVTLPQFYVRQGTSGADIKINDEEKLTFINGNLTTVTVANQANPTVKYDHNSVTRSDTTTSSAPDFASTFDVVDGITTSAEGHITAVNVKTVTVPRFHIRQGTTGTSVTLNDDENISFINGTYTTAVVADQANPTVTFNHNSTTRSDSANTIDPLTTGSVAMVDSVTTNTQGHVTGINVKTVNFDSRYYTETEVENAISDSIPAGALGQVPFNREDGTRFTEMDYTLKIGQYVDNASDLSAAQTRITTQEDIFLTWYRFSHNTSNVYPASQAETEAWAYDPVSETINNTTNSGTYIGMVSLDRYVDYVHEVRLSSSNSDDDAIGVVIAFYDDGVREHTLSAVRSPGGWGMTWQVIYNIGQSDAQVIADGNSQIAWGNGAYGATGAAAGYVTNQAIGGWDDFHPTGTLVKVTRSGDSITCETTELGSSVYKPAATLTFSLTDLAILNKFRGPKSIGYSTFSQAGSVFTVLDFADVSNAIVDATDGTIYLYQSGAWVAQPSTFNVWSEIGVGRLLYDPYTKNIFYVDSETSVTKVVHNRDDEFTLKASSDGSMVSLDTRNIDYTPSSRDRGLYADFKTNTTTGLNDGFTYHGVLTFRPYGFSTDMTGGTTHQLGFTNNGNLWMRESTDASTWNSWHKINYDSWTISDGTNSEAIASKDTLTFSASGAASVSYSTATNTMTIGATDTNTTYSIALSDGAAGEVDLDLTAGGSGSGTDTVTLKQGTNVTLSRAGDVVTITSANDNTTYTAGDGLDLTGTSFSVDLTDTAKFTSSGAASRGVVTDASGNINWNTTGRGLTWGLNTDGAHIKFFNTGDGDTDSRLEFSTSDNGDEYFRWAHQLSGGGDETLMTLKRTGVGQATLTASVFSGTATTARYADLAEMYEADADYETGTVLVIGGDAEVTQCLLASDHRVIGVVSTDPAYLMNSELNSDYPVAVALRGRIPCKVTGPVRKGDTLVTSDIPGHAQATNDPDVSANRIIGKALQAKPGFGEGVIEIIV